MTNGQWRKLALLVSAWSAVIAMFVVGFASEHIAQQFEDEGTQFTIVLFGGGASFAVAANSTILVYSKIMRIKVQRRKRDILCVSCAYDLRASDSGACPECGTEFSRSDNA